MDFLNAFHLGYIGHIVVLAYAASNTEVWKFTQIKNYRLPSSNGRQSTKKWLFSSHIPLACLLKISYLLETGSNS